MKYLFSLFTYRKNLIFQINEKLCKTSNTNESDSHKSQLLGSDYDQSVKEIIDCDSSSAHTQLTEMLSSDQEQEMKND